MSKMNPPPHPEWPEEPGWPPYITLAHMFNAPPGWNIRDRTMSQYVLQYVVDGVADYPVEDRHYRTVRGDLLFHRPGERHSILTHDGKPYICISIVFHFGSSPFPLEEAFGGAHLLGNFAEHPIHTMLSQLVIHYHQPGEHHRLASQGLLLQILAGAAESLAGGRQTAEPMDMKIHARMVLVKNYLQQHFDRPLRSEELARISGLSENYVTIQFKRVFGMTPSQYLLRVRADKAKQLALHTDLSISEIARQVGYADVHTFGRMFKKVTGYNLSSFRSSLFGNVFT